MIEEDRIRLTRCAITEPGLLLVSKQVREETLSIFYSENKWKIDLPSYSRSIITGIMRRIAENSKGGNAKRLGITWTSTGSLIKKTTLLDFVRAVHDGSLEVNIVSRIGRIGPKEAAMGAFDIARQMEERPWEEVDRVLQVYLVEVARGRDWSWDE